MTPEFLCSKKMHLKSFSEHHDFKNLGSPIIYRRTPHSSAKSFAYFLSILLHSRNSLKIRVMSSWFRDFAVGQNGGISSHPTPAFSHCLQSNDRIWMERRWNWGRSVWLIQSLEARNSAKICWRIFLRRFATANWIRDFLHIQSWWWMARRSENKRNPMFEWSMETLIRHPSMEFVQSKYADETSSLMRSILTFRSCPWA